MARTIDNYGIEISNRYAEDQALLDEKLIKESRQMPFQIGIETTQPSFSPEFALLFELQLRGARIALFQAPFGYHSQRRGLFTQQLIPVLGSLEKKEAQKNRVRNVPPKTEEPAPQPTSEEPVEIPEPLFTDTVQREKRILLKLLSEIEKYDQVLIDINSRRTQYHKG